MANQVNEPTTRCPWCSAALPIPGAVACTACGATLVTSDEGPEPEIRGVTTLDPEAILRARAEVSRPRNRLLSFLTGDVVGTEARADDAGSVAPPPNEVRREMLRLRLEAERADAEAELISQKTDVLTARGIHLADLAADDANAADDADDGGGEPPSG
jgi:hypothetical protein